MKTLVIVLSETRAHELTFNNFQANVLDTLNADLAVCIGTKADYDTSNPFWQRAKYQWAYPEPDDFAKAFDEASNDILHKTVEARRPWRDFLKVKDQFMGGVKDPNDEHPGSAGILLFFRWFCLTNLVASGAIDLYDWFIVTRSDFLYTLPHPCVEIFSPEYIYIPDGEHYGGVTDRHAVLSRLHVKTYFNILNEMVLRSDEYIAYMAGHEQWNLEKLILLHLHIQGLGQSVRHFPYVMYSVRHPNGSTRWSEGSWSDSHGYFIKYQSEYNMSQAHKANYDALGTSRDLNTFYLANICAAKVSHADGRAQSGEGLVFGRALIGDQCRQKG